MKAHAIIGTLTVMVPAWAGVLIGQDGAPCPEIYPNPQIGHYAEVEFADAEQGRVPIRFAVIGEEEVDGRTHYWIEILSEPPSVQGSVIAQMLVPAYPFDQQDIRGYIVKMPGRPAQRVPPEYIQMSAGSATTGPSWAEKCAAAEDMGVEETTVRAGTFKARHFRIGAGEGEVWIADVPFGLVRWEMADSRMELLRFGDDAESSITEKPVEIQIPGSPNLR